MTSTNSHIFKYTAYGLNIHSEILLPELTSHEFDKADLIICFGKVDPSSEKYIIEGKDFKITNSTIYRFWNEIGRFKITNGSEIIIDPSPNVNKRLLRSFILGTVFASLLNQRGFLVLHASAVNIDNKAIAFLGDKGFGKSTMAMAFYIEGYSILADDYIAIDFKDGIPLVYPGFPSLKLSLKSRIYGGFDSKKIYFNDQEMDKIYISTEKNFLYGKLPLENIYMLKRDNGLKITGLNPQNALMDLVKNTFGISRFKKSDFKINLVQCAKILEYTSFSILELPDSLEEISNVVDFVKTDILL